MSDNPYERPGYPGGLSRAVHNILWGTVIVVCGGLVFLLLLSLPFGRMSRGSAYRSQCRNNLKQIALALHNYADVHQVLPPAYTVDGKVRPLHRWRTLILPYLHEKKLYDSIDLSEPWDDPAHADAHRTDPYCFRCPATDIPDGHTTYAGLVGANS